MTRLLACEPVPIIMYFCNVLCYIYNTYMGNAMNRTGLILAFAVVMAWPGMAEAPSRSAEGDSMHSSQIVFVCEHGAALSVVAAAYFNKRAREQHLSLHAIARGTTPQEDIAVSARDGLQADGVPSETKRPQVLSAKDASHALRIVAFCPLPAQYRKMAPVETWNDVPATGVNYPLARDTILKHINELIRQLKQNGTQK
jgi:arsenate reductase (thioredoxin)